MFYACLFSILISSPVNTSCLSLHDAEQAALAAHAQIVLARLDVLAADFFLKAAGRFANPELHYAVSNLVLGKGNDQGENLRPGFLDQSIQVLEVSKSFDVWWQRGPKTHYARLSKKAKLAVAEDAARFLLRDVRLAFAALMREADELALAQSASMRFSRSVALMRRRFDAGDVPETALLQLELEGMHVANAEVIAEGEWAQARRALAALMLVDDAATLSPTLCRDDAVTLVSRAEAAFDGSRDELLHRALQTRPDLRALTLEHAAQSAHLIFQKRAALPPVALGLSYARSKFQISGDNPHAAGLTIGVNLPLFDRNQLEISEARLALRRVEADQATLKVLAKHQITTSLEASGRSRRLLARYDEGGMLARAEKILAAQEGQVRHGAISVLNFLEAERTFFETRADYLRMHFERWRSAIDLLWALGEETNT